MTLQDMGVVGPTFQITATIATVAPDVPRRDPAQLPFVIRPEGAGSQVSGNLTWTDAGTYRGQALGVGEGLYDVIASFPDGSGASSVTVTVDATPPALTIVPDSVAPPTGPPARPLPEWTDPRFPDGAWKRDETTTLLVSATEPIANPTFSLSGTDGGTISGSLTPGATGCGGSAFCGSATLDFAAPAMNAFRGNFHLTVSGADLVGNVGSASQDLPVTRYRWMVGLGIGGFSRSPAVGSAGTVYIPSGGRVHAINPDGTRKWTAFMAGSVLPSVAVGRADGGVEPVYVAAGGQLVVVVDGGVVPGAACPVSNSGNIYAAPMVTDLAGVEGAVSYINGGLVSVRPSDPSNRCASSASTGPEGALLPTNVVGENDRAFVATNTGTLYGFDYPAPGPAWNEALSRPDAGSLSGSVLAAAPGMVVLGAGPGLTGLTYPGGFAWTSYATDNIRHLVFSSCSTLMVVDEGPPSMLRLVAYGDPTESFSVSIPEATSSPVIGQDGVVYVVAKSSGQVSAYSPELELLWTEDFGPMASGDSSPTIDCSRDPSGSKRAGRPGTLYVGTNFSRLRAVVVDSRGVDLVGSPWPKYQRDPRNTGSLSTDPSEFACP